jgi:lysophospholipase L1-like esterase
VLWRLPVGQVLASAGGLGTVYGTPKALVVGAASAGPLSDPWFRGIFAGGHDKTADLAKHYRALASFMKVAFFDAGSVVATAGVDGIHFTAKNNSDLGRALASKVAEMFAPAV